MSRLARAALVVAAAVPLLSRVAAASPAVDRLAGNDRYATSAAVSASFAAPGVPVAYIANGDEFADALVAGPAAAKEGGVVLLVRRDELPSAVSDELRRLQPKRIAILGGTSAVSAAVELQLREFAPAVDRLAGSDRYQTAIAITKDAFGLAGTVYIVTGRDFPDALSGGQAGAAVHDPLLLVDRDTIPPGVEDEIRRIAPPRIEIVGGTDVVSPAVEARLRQLASEEVRRLAGGDRYATAAAVMDETYLSTRPRVLVASGRSFPDALSALALVGAQTLPLLLAEPTCLPAPMDDELTRFQATRATIVGGDASVDSTAPATRC